MSTLLSARLALGALLGLSLGAQAAPSHLDDQTQLPKAPTKGVSPYFQPPQIGELPNNAFGEMVRRGEALFVNTKALAPQYVGNEMNCVNCHLDRGRKANSAPLWAAYGMYPAYRKKNNKVNTFVERMSTCSRLSGAALSLLMRYCTAV